MVQVGPVARDEAFFSRGPVGRPVAAVAHQGVERLGSHGPEREADHPPSAPCGDRQMNHVFRGGMVDAWLVNRQSLLPRQMGGRVEAT